MPEANSTKESLKLIEEQFRRAVEEAPIPMILQTEDGQALQISKSWTALTGYKLSDVSVFDNWITKAVCGNADVVRGHMHDLYKGGLQRIDIVFQVSTIQGALRYWSFSAYSPGILLDGRRFIVGLAVDITEHKKAEEEISVARDSLGHELAALSKLHEISMRLVNFQNVKSLYSELLHAAIELTQADMGNVQLVDKEGNLKIVAHCGFETAFLNLFHLVIPDSPAPCRQAKESKRRVIVEDVTKSPLLAGTQALKVLVDAGVWACQSTPLVTRSGEILGVISTHYRRPKVPSETDLRLLDLLVRQATDLIEGTETLHSLQQRTLELEKAQAKLDEDAAKLEQFATSMEVLADQRLKQLKDEERLVTIGQTAGMVGHDIRNPLQAISGDMYLIREDAKTITDEQTRKSIIETADSIEDNLNYINKIVTDLQDMIRPLQPSVESVPIKSLLCSVLDDIKVPSNIQTAILCDDSLVTLSDPSFLKRALTNLANNALQAMPQGGKLTIAAYTQQGKTIISVEDTGVGISEAAKAKMFTPLFTTKSKGQGLGLVAIKRLVEALEGTIRFESQEGKGTKFIIELPFAKKY